jgi:hypothetical protein
MKTKISFMFVMIMMIIAFTNCKKFEMDEMSQTKPTHVTPTSSEVIRYEREDGGKSIMAGPIVDSQLVSFTTKGIETFFYLEDQAGAALNGNWTITQTLGGTAYYANNATDQIMWNFPNDGDYTVTVSGVNPTNSLAFSHTFFVHIGSTVVNPTNVPVKVISVVAVTGGWEIMMKFHLTPGGLATTSAPFGYAWINECQPSLLNHLPLTFVGDSATTTFTIPNVSNNLYYANASGSRFKFTYLVKQQAGDGTVGNNGMWATPSGAFFANNATGSGQMFEFYIDLSTGVITAPNGTIVNPDSVNFSMPGAVGDNIFRAKKIGAVMNFWSLYPTNLVTSIYKKAQYKIGVNGTWTNFTNNPSQWNTTEYFGTSIPYSAVSGVGDVFIRFGEEIGGIFTINPNSVNSPAFDPIAGGFSFR